MSRGTFIFGDLKCFERIVYLCSIRILKIYDQHEETFPYCLLSHGFNG